MSSLQVQEFGFYHVGFIKKYGTNCEVDVFGDAGLGVVEAL